MGKLLGFLHCWELMLSTFLGAPSMAPLRFETRAEVTEAFRADQFDLFPSPIGKLLNASTAETWKSLEWSWNGCKVPRKVPPQIISGSLSFFRWVRYWDTRSNKKYESYVIIKRWFTFV